MLRTIQAATEDANVVLVVAHAPGLPAAASFLADGEGDDEAHEQLSQGFPAGALAVLSYRGHWSDLSFGAAVLDGFWAPAG